VIVMEEIIIIRKWKDKTGRFQYGMDDKGNLYCRDLVKKVNLVCIDPYYKVRNHWYYVFMYPDTKEIHKVLKQ